MRRMKPRQRPEVEKPHRNSKRISSAARELDGTIVRAGVKQFEFIIATGKGKRPDPLL